MHWAFRINRTKPEWVKVVKNGGFPKGCGVTYEIVKVDGAGNVLEVDGVIRDASFNVCARLRECLRRKVIHAVEDT